MTGKERERRKRILKKANTMYYYGLQVKEQFVRFKHWNVKHTEYERKEEQVKSAEGEDVSSGLAFRSVPWGLLQFCNKFIRNLCLVRLGAILELNILRFVS